jgi:prefoldin subunit 5
MRGRASPVAPSTRDTDEAKLNERIDQRIAELKQDFQRGEERLRELDMQQAQLRETMLRIAGAIQVLEELRGGQEGGESPASPPD